MGFDFSEELWWQNLIEWILDEGKIVTFKTLASKQNVHVNMAKKMLATFYQGQHHEKLSAFYVIIGETRNNNGLKVQIVAEKDVKRTETSLKKVRSKHIFALCRHKTDMSSADILQALQEIKPNQMIPLRAIKYTPKMKHKPKEESKSQEKVEVKPESQEIHVKKVKKEDKSNEDILSGASQKMQDKGKGTQKGGGGSIAAMFAKAPPPKAKKAKEEPVDTIPSSSKRIHMISSSDEDEEESVKESAKDASQSKTNSKKRGESSSKSSPKQKRIHMISSSEEDEEEIEKDKMKPFLERILKTKEQVKKENDEEVVLETPKNEKQNALKGKGGRKSEEEEAKKSVSQPKSAISVGTIKLEPSAKKSKSSEKSNNKQSRQQPKNQASIKNFFTRK